MRIFLGFQNTWFLTFSSSFFSLAFPQVGFGFWNNFIAIACEWFFKQNSGNNIFFRKALRNVLKPKRSIVLSSKNYIHCTSHIPTCTSLLSIKNKSLLSEQIWVTNYPIEYTFLVFDTYLVREMSQRYRQTFRTTYICNSLVVVP